QDDAAAFRPHPFRAHGAQPRPLSPRGPAVRAGQRSSGNGAARRRAARDRVPENSGEEAGRAPGGHRDRERGERNADRNADRQAQARRRRGGAVSTKPSEGHEDAIKIPDVLPVLPLKDTVIFPYIILPLSVGREKSVVAVDRALAESRVIMLVAQRDGAIENPGEGDLFPVGTAAIIMRMLKLPDGRIRILVQGLARAHVAHISQTDPYLQAKIERIEEPPVLPGLQTE